MGLGYGAPYPRNEPLVIVENNREFNHFYPGTEVTRLASKSEGVFGFPPEQLVTEVIDQDRV